MKKDIKDIRNEINKIDQEMRELFLKRLECSKDVAEYKKEHNLPILDSKREQEVVENEETVVKIVEQNKSIYAVDYFRFMTAVDSGNLTTDTTQQTYYVELSGYGKLCAKIVCKQQVNLSV